jgi:transposase
VSRPQLSIATVYRNCLSQLSIAPWRRVVSPCISSRSVHGQRPTAHIDPYIPYLQERWNAGGHNALTLWRPSGDPLATLWRAIHAQGYPAGVAQVRRLVTAWRTPPSAPGIPGRPLSAKEEAVSYSARQTRWLLTRAEARLSARERVYPTTLKLVCPQIAEAQRLLTTFHSLLTDLTERASLRLDGWLQQCERSDIAEFVRFAQGPRRDEAAVRAALRYPGRQGPVEGQVNRSIASNSLNGRCMAGQDAHGCVGACWLSLRFLPEVHQPLSTKSAYESVKYDQEFNSARLLQVLPVLHPSPTQH